MQVSGRGSDYDVYHYQVMIEMLLSDFLLREVGLLPQKIQELRWLGAIYINEERYTGADDPILKVGFKLRVHTEPRRYFSGSLISRIIKKTVDYYVVDKPGGVPSHALVDNLQENILKLLSDELQEKLFITHRLDVGTSGMLIIARNPEAQEKINNLIREKKIKRFYQAVIEGPLEPGNYVHYLEPSPKAPKKMSMNEKNGWLKCELVVRGCEKVSDKNLPALTYKLEIELITGRSQQIRAQLASLGFPIIGDTTYGSKISYFDTFTHEKAIALRANSVEGLY